MHQNSASKIQAFLAEWKAIEEKSTPGPWVPVSSNVEDSVGHEVAKAYSTPALDGRSLFERARDNAAFIAFSRNHSEQIRAALEEAVEMLELISLKHQGRPGALGAIARIAALLGGEKP